MSSWQNLLLTVRDVAEQKEARIQKSMKDGGESDQGQQANSKPEDLLNLTMTADEHRSPLSKTSSTKEPGEL